MATVKLDGIGPFDDVPRVDSAWISANAYPESARCTCSHPKGVHGWQCSECRCCAFLPADEPMRWKTFAWRLLDEYHRRADKDYARRWGALRQSFIWSGMQATPAPWDEWLAKSARAWRAWQAAGRPAKAFGREIRWGDVSIPALEER